MTIRDIPMFRALAAAVRANAPVFLLGNPGQAKSATINALADAWGRHCETVIGSNRDRTDFLGTMIEVDGEVHYSTLGWVRRLNEADSGLLFCDELTTTAPDVQKAMLRVIQERYVVGLGFVRADGSIDVLAEVDGRYLSNETAGSFTGRVFGVYATSGTVLVDRITYEGDNS